MYHLCHTLYCLFLFNLCVSFGFCFFSYNVKLSPQFGFNVAFMYFVFCFVVLSDTSANEQNGSDVPVHIFIF